MGKLQSLTLLMILCYTCRQKPSINVLSETTQLLTETDASAHSQTSDRGQDCYGSVWGKIDVPESDRNSTVRPTTLLGASNCRAYTGWMEAKIPGHICCRGLPCLASMEEDEYNPAETCYSRVERCWGRALLSQRLRGGVGERLWERRDWNGDSFCRYK